MDEQDIGSQSFKKKLRYYTRSLPARLRTVWKILIGRDFNIVLEGRGGFELTASIVGADVIRVAQMARSTEQSAERLKESIRQLPEEDMLSLLADTSSNDPRFEDIKKYIKGIYK